MGAAGFVLDALCSLLGPRVVKFVHNAADLPQHVHTNNGAVIGHWHLVCSFPVAKRAIGSSSRAVLIVVLFCGTSWGLHGMTTGANHYKDDISH